MQILFEIDMWKNKRYGKITYRYTGTRNSGIPVHEKYRCLHTKVLLLDETFAALDPAAKAVVMRELAAFCAESLLLVIYHVDSGACVPRSFDAHLRFADGNASFAPLC